MYGLTSQQHRTLVFLATLQRQGSIMPSVVELRDHMGLLGVSAAHRLIEALVERGYVRKLPRLARALEVLPDAMERLRPTLQVLDGLEFIPASQLGMAYHGRPTRFGSSYPAAGRLP